MKVKYEEGNAKVKFISHESMISMKTFCHLFVLHYFLQQERLDIEEKYSTLQEEVAGKTKKLKKVWTMLMQAKSEVRLTVRKIGSLLKKISKCKMLPNQCF